MLNDLARPTRLLLAGFGLAIGVMLAGPVAGASGGAAAALLFTGIALELVVIGTVPVVTGRGERAFRAELVAGTEEIAGGAVEAVPALGRVVRRRAVDLPSWMPGRGGAPGGRGATALMVLTAVGDGPARRVAVLVPTDLGLESPGVPALLLVHPTRREVAVLDDRVTPERLGEVDTDPRWDAERLPTDRTVVGGYLALAGSLALGIAAGIGAGALVVTLAT